MVERLLILLVVVVMALVAWRQLQRRAERRRDADGLAPLGYRPGAPAVLYFTAPGCAPCESVQKPALQRVADRFGGRLQVLEVDANLQPRWADAWGVLAVPTTFLIDRTGRVRRVNHGPTREHTLLAQFAEIGEVPTRLQSSAEVEAAASPGEGKRDGTIARIG
jgi:thiol-disulfide isomerase/thioredoxin